MERVEILQGLQRMARENIAKREAYGIDGENPDFVVLTNAMAELLPNVQVGDFTHRVELTGALLPAS